MTYKGYSICKDYFRFGDRYYVYIGNIIYLFDTIEDAKNCIDLIGDTAIHGY